MKRVNKFSCSNKMFSLLTLLLTPTVGHFHPKESSSALWTPAGWPPIQFTSESTLSWSKCPQEIPQPHQHPQTQAPTNLPNTPTDGGSPYPPPKNSWNT